jgi:hypothetical protein
VLEERQRIRRTEGNVLSFSQIGTVIIATLCPPVHNIIIETTQSESVLTWIVCARRLSFFVTKEVTTPFVPILAVLPTRCR